MDKMKLNAATLIETMVSMVILSIIISISSISIVNAIRVGNVEKKFLANALIQENFIEMLQEHNFIEKKEIIDEIIIISKISKYNDFIDLYCISFQCLNIEGEVLASQKMLFSINGTE